MDDMSRMKTWVDASYATDHDIRSHTGVCIMLGKSFLNTKSSKQNLITKSSNKDELVGSINNLSQTIWTKNFIESHGYSVNSCGFLRDNTSQCNESRTVW